VSWPSLASVYARIGGNDGSEISQMADESFEKFEDRAIAAAKNAGDRWVAIEAYERWVEP
jgi:hypothetical protein